MGPRSLSPTEDEKRIYCNASWIEKFIINNFESNVEKNVAKVH